MELSIIMPCLNEAETVAACVRKARASLEALGIEGEVIVADNGSTDQSRQIAVAEGARVIEVAERGYGCALRAGIAVASGRFLLMADADDSYDFSAIGPFVTALREGADLVMGCRMPAGGGKVLPGAMPWKHRWIGNPVLTFIGRLLFRCPAHDFHCGMRAFTRDAYQRMDLATTGMEFASEMVIKATLRGLLIREVPITLYPDGRSRPPHLRSWRDGWRHLRFMLLFSPRWLFFHPGISMSSIGLFGIISLALGQMKLGTVTLDVGTMMASAMSLLLGVQLVWFAVFTRAFVVAEGLLPPNRRLKRLLDAFTLEWGLVIGLVFCIAGGVVFGLAVWDWQMVGFGELPYSRNLRRLILSFTLVLLGIQWMFGSFFLGVLGLKSGLVSTQSQGAGHGT